MSDRGSYRKPFRHRFGPKKFKQPAPTMEDKIKSFVIRNSRNGFFTKVNTLAFKFEITKDEAWSLAGGLLADNVLECTHDSRGDAKLCEAGKLDEVQQKEYARMGAKKNQNPKPKNRDSNRNVMK